MSERESLAGPLLEPTIITDGGPWADHNMPCAVCRALPAVLALNSGRFEPCWTCQRAGWRTVRRRRWRARGRR